MKQRVAKPPLPTKPSVLASPDVLGVHDGVTFQRERLPKILREVLPLLKRDWEENGIDHKPLPLAINLQQYLDYDLCGILQIVTAREEDMLVGYVFAYVHPHIDHVGLGWAMLTWYWLFPEYRGCGIGNAMIEAMEKFLREAKVSVVEASEKFEHQHGLFKRRGYKPTDIAYRKLLEG